MSVALFACLSLGAIAQDQSAPAPAKPSPSTEAPAPTAPKSDSAPAASNPSTPVVTTGPTDVEERLSKVATVLQQTTHALQRANLDDDTLANLSSGLSPALLMAQSVVVDLTPILNTMAASQAQIGAKSGDATKTEAASLAVERSEQQKQQAAVEDQFKRAHLLIAQIQQTDDTIHARRRDLLVKTLSQRTDSILSPGLWARSIKALPGEFRALSLLISDYVRACAKKLPGWQGAFFFGLILLVLLANIPLSRVVRSVLARAPTAQAPSELLKALSAAWISLVISVLPIVTIMAIYGLGQAFDLGSARLSPVFSALLVSVSSIALAAGLSNGVLAHERSEWRLVGIEDSSARLLTRAAPIAAGVVSLDKIISAVNEVTAASQAILALTQGLGVILSAAVIGVPFYIIGSKPDDNDLSSDHRWMSVLRVLILAVCIFAVLTAAAGYIRIASTAIEILIWLLIGLALAFVAMPLVTRSLEAGFRPNTRIGRFLIVNLGVSPEGVQQLSVILSGFGRVLVYFFTFAFIAAPFGFATDDIETSLMGAFNGFVVGGVVVSPRSILGAIAFSVAGLAATRAIRRWVTDKYLPTTRLDAGLSNAIGTSVGYIGAILTIGLTLGQLGLSLEKVTLVAGALSVGIGFGLQSIISNFVSGIIVLWEGAVRVGDWIVVGTDQGFVRKISVRATEIETFDRATMIMPNSNLITGVVKNWVRFDRIGRIRIKVTVAVSSDPEQIQQILVGVAKDHELIAKIPTPHVLFLSIDGDGLKFELVCFVEDVVSSNRVQSDLHFDIFKQFKDNNIEIAAPSEVKVTLAGPTEALVFSSDSSAKTFASKLEDAIGRQPSAQPVAER